MKKTIWIIILIALIGFGIWYFNKGKNEMVSPKSESEKSEKVEDNGPIGGQKVPKEFKFDASSNLNLELENINPQVLDSDFTDLQNTIKSF